MVAPAAIGGRLTAAGAIGSTSAELKRMVREAYPAVPWGLALWTTEQQAGYGQRGRAWVTPPGASLAVSFVAPAGPAPGAWPFRAGLAAREALGREAVRLKWVNDLVAEGRKLGGVLVEGLGEAVVIGIGINLWPRPEAGPEAVALAELGGEPPAPEALAAALGRALAGWASRADWPAAWEAASATIGQDVAVYPTAWDGAGAPELAGRAVGLAPDGALRLVPPDGAEVLVRQGRIRRPDGSYC